MTIADDRTYLVDTTTDVDCDSCGWTNETVIWDDTRTGEWSYEFECASCGHWNKEHGNRDERGAANILFILIITGLALAVVGALGRAWPDFIEKGGDRTCGTG